jgi:hypothetical protein
VSPKRHRELERMLERCSPTGPKATDRTAREMRQSTSRSDQLRRQVSGARRRTSTFSAVNHLSASLG